MDGHTTERGEMRRIFASSTPEAAAIGPIRHKGSLFPSRISSAGRILDLTGMTGRDLGNHMDLPFRTDPFDRIRHQTFTTHLARVSALKRS